MADGTRQVRGNTSIAAIIVVISSIFHLCEAIQVFDIFYLVMQHICVRFSSFLLQQ